MVSCCVSACNVTRRFNPNQYTFHRFPTNPALREKWMRIINRPDWSPNKYSKLCSKHFEGKCFVQRKHRIVLMKDSIPTLFVPNHMENCAKNKFVAEMLKLKKDGVRFFLCQKQGSEAADRLAVEKRSKNKILHDLPTVSKKNMEEIFLVQSAPPEIVNEDTLSNHEFGTKPTLVEKCSKKTQAEDTEAEDFDFKNHMQKTAVMCIFREPQLLLGVPKECYFTIDLLSEHCKCSHRDIMITLKKIRLYQSNVLLALDFGLTHITIGRIFRRTLPAVASCMKTLIFSPDSQEVTTDLPIAFRKRYSNVQSVIDCLEIQIEKPADVVQQALTWSEYKGCNTIKYLISFTPDGLINFISEGYSGRTSDSLIFEDCGILEKIPRNATILAERGFENIAHLLFQKECTLIRPPSVFSNTTIPKDEVIETEEIAALRIHVERTMARMSHFGFLMPRACVEYNQIDLLDYIIVTTCGIVNLQSCVFDQSYDTNI